MFEQCSSPLDTRVPPIVPTTIASMSDASVEPLADKSSSDGIVDESVRGARRRVRPADWTQPPEVATRLCIGTHAVPTTQVLGDHVVAIVCFRLPHSVFCSSICISQHKLCQCVLHVVCSTCHLLLSVAPVALTRRDRGRLCEA